jgi:glycosyltransferase involved in cell wall biosynthesis
MTEPVPTVSIVLPFRNAAAHLPDSLRSITRQTLDSYELLAIDDGSEDASAEIVRTHALRDPRLQLLQPGRIGLVGALNLGLAQARAALIARMDADDLMHPRRLELQTDFLNHNQSVALVASRVVKFPRRLVRGGFAEYLRWQNGLLSPVQIAANIYVEAPIVHPSVMFRRNAVYELGDYRDGPFPEDYELWLRMHAAGLQMAKIPRVLLAWQERADRASRVDPRYARDAFDQLRASYLKHEPRLQTGRDLVYWGAGRNTRRRARLLIVQGFAPAAWIDIDPRKIGAQVWGAPVHAPAWLDRQPRPFVLVYVNNHGARDLIDEQLQALGYRPGEDYLGVG